MHKSIAFIRYMNEYEYAYLNIELNFEHVFLWYISSIAMWVNLIDRLKKARSMNNAIFDHSWN